MVDVVGVEVLNKVQCGGVVNKGFAGRSRGTALLEFCVVVPFIIPMIYGITDIAAAVNQYMRVSRIAYEGVRYATSLGALEERACRGKGVNDNSGICDGDKKIGEVAAAQARLQDRIRALLKGNGFGNSLNDATMYTCYRRESDFPAKDEVADNCRFLEKKNTVGVRIEFKFKPFGGLFGPNAITLASKATGPYLAKI